MDIKDTAARSKNMAAIKNKDTQPEVYFRKLLFAKGYRYRKNTSNVFGHPDIYLAKYKTAIFIHGCFWHRHRDCKYASQPKSRIEFWTEKFRRNVERDELVVNTLKNQNVKVLIIWECTLKKMKKECLFETEILEEVQSFINDDAMYLEL